MKKSISKYIILTIHSIWLALIYLVNSSLRLRYYNFSSISFCSQIVNLQFLSSQGIFFCVSIIIIQTSLSQNNLLRRWLPTLINTEYISNIYQIQNVIMTEFPNFPFLDSFVRVRSLWLAPKNGKTTNVWYEIISTAQKGLLFFLALNKWDWQNSNYTRGIKQI